MKLFEVEKTDKKKLTDREMKEIKSDIQKLYVAKDTLFYTFCFSDIEHKNFKYDHIRNLMKDYSIEEIAQKAVNDEVVVDLPELYFSNRVILHKKDIERTENKAMGSQYEEIQLYKKDIFGNEDMQINIEDIL